MRLWDDERAVTVQIGAVLLLGFVVISMSMYQATVVPNENRQVEFRHNERVQGDMQEVRNAILRTAAADGSTSVAVELGTRYPTRAVFVNPGSPGGTLSTSSLGNLTVRNAVADDAETAGDDFGEIDDFWNGADRHYATKALTYRPRYAQYQTAPETTYENGLVYNRFDSGNVTLTDQSVVSGRRISLVALSGELSRGGAGTLSVDPRPVSVSTRTVPVSAEAGENVSVVVPTRLGNGTWERLLRDAGQFDGTGNESNHRYVHAVNDGPRTDTVELVFERNATYRLKLSRVGVGADAGETKPAYATSVRDIGYPFFGQSYAFEVEVRDRYNNPVPANVVAAGNRTTIPDGVAVDAGRFRYRYAPKTTGDESVNVTYEDPSVPEHNVSGGGFDGGLPENVQYDVTVQSTGDDGGSDTSAITVTRFDVRDDSNKQKIVAKAEVTAEDSDGDDDIRWITIELVNGNGDVVSSSSQSYDGVANATHDAKFDERRDTDPYVIRITVTDGDDPPNEEVKEKPVG